jgi:general nucleoside transport system ATP-binding protein
MPDTPYAVQMENIVIRFPGVLANDRVNFTLKQGEIHALLGENGAGKSTLMSALYGLYKPTSGVIRVNSKPVSFNSPKDAIAAGIGMVHQHFMLVPTQTVTENILLGLDTPRFWMNLPEYDRKVIALQDQFGLRVDPTAQIWQLAVGEQQRVEILKTLYRGANVLIFDEPTAVLAPAEIAEFIQTMRSLVAQGKSIIFISHKLHEVEAVADRITVLRKGKGTAEGFLMAGLNKEKLAQLMVGRDVVFAVKKEAQAFGSTILEVKNLQAANNKGTPALRGVSLTIRAGEVLGIAGVAGNGQSELAECITGLRVCETGSVQVDGLELANQPPITAIHAGVSHIPEDRTRVGSAPNLTITDNVIMKHYRSAPIGNGATIDAAQATSYAQNLKKTYDILAPSVRTQARKLSGGNLQKVILSREITANPRLIVAVQPTRGLDVGAVEAIQEHLLEQRKQGAAILLISEELEELLTLSDRIAVLFDGRVMGVVGGATASVEEIGLMMMGAERTIA